VCCQVQWMQGRAQEGRAWSMLVCLVVVGRVVSCTTRVAVGSAVLQGCVLCVCRAQAC
jgi:hypothetical protein